MVWLDLIFFMRKDVKPVKTRLQIRESNDEYLGGHLSQ